MFINLLVFLVFLYSQENELSNELSNILSIEFTNIEDNIPKQDTINRKHYTNDKDKIKIIITYTETGKIEEEFNVLGNTTRITNYIKIDNDEYIKHGEEIEFNIFKTKIVKNFVFGKIQGPTYTYLDDGSIKNITNYLDNKKHGEEVEFFSYTNTVKRKTLYRDNLINGKEEIYNILGKLKEIKIYNNGILVTK